MTTRGTSTNRERKRRRTMSARKTIVIAWTEESSEWDGKPYARDRGQQPTMIPTRIAKACVWLNEGGEADLVAAKRYADGTFHRVFTYPTTERDPLARAKHDALAAEVSP
jgi:hypothetical protein